MRSKVRGKKFNLTFAELTSSVDALFDETEDPGWILMYASPKGRDHINGLFPRAHIEWRELGDERFPSDWCGFTINLPDTVAATETKLPLHILPARHTIDDCNQGALALLLALAVGRDGGCAARVDYSRRKPRVEIFGPKAN